jgi:hypothetical protein
LLLLLLFFKGFFSFSFSFALISVSEEVKDPFSNKKTRNYLVFVLKSHRDAKAKAKSFWLALPVCGLLMVAE